MKSGKMLLIQRHYKVRTMLEVTNNNDDKEVEDANKSIDTNNITDVERVPTPQEIVFNNNVKEELNE